MSAVAKEALRYVTIGLAFGLIWATMQFTKGQIRDFSALVGPVCTFGGAGFLMWCLRRAFVHFRNR
jgi:hypothetical protein